MTNNFVDVNDPEQSYNYATEMSLQDDFLKEKLQLQRIQSGHILMQEM
jgi:hypothetical protein